MLTGRVVALDRNEVGEARSWYARLVGKLGEPVARAALKQAMRILGHQFVMGRDIESALTRAAGKEERDYRYSFDMLGEAALTRADAERYREKYSAAIAARGQGGRDARVDHRAPQHLDQAVGAASALRIRAGARASWPSSFRSSKRWCAQARDAGIGVTLDAEEAERLELSLLLVERAARKRSHARLRGLRARGAGLSEARLRHARMADRSGCATPTGASRCGW